MARVLVLGGISASLISFRGPMLKEMVGHGHEVFACASSASHKTRDALIELGVTYHEINIDRTGIKPLRDIRTLIQIFKLFKRIKPDVFLGYTIKPVIYGSFAAQLANVPKIYSMISGLGYAFSKANLRSRVVGVFAQWLYRLALGYNQKVFFQNPDNLHLFLEMKLIKSQDKAVLVNGSGVDIEKFCPAPLPESLSFLLIARLIKDKGIYEYVEAATIIKRKHPEVKFRLVGFIDSNPSAISEKDLNSWVESGVIEYLGLQRDVRPAIADCSVYVLPSFYPEGTPHSVLEAMAMGRAIITTDTPGCRETVVVEENGFLVPVKNAQKLADAMVHYISHPLDIERMGLRSRKIAEEKYDVHKVNAIILNTMGLS